MELDPCAKARNDDEDNTGGSIACIRGGSAYNEPRDRSSSKTTIAT